jgi:hypothetical protein
MEDFEIENGVLTEYQGEDVDVIVPEGVREIGEGAFWRCDVESVRLPQGIRAIRSEAFMNCRSLRRINLPESVRTIETEAFHGSGLRAIRLPEGLKRIEADCFSGTELTEIVIPEGVRVIKSGSVDVSGNDGGSIVHIPAGVERIESSAFRGDIPRIVSASGAAFGCLSLRGCSHLLSLTVPAGTEVSECAFGFDEESKRLRSRLTVQYTGGTE